MDMQSEIQKDTRGRIIPTLSCKATTVAALPLPAETFKSHKSCFLTVVLNGTSRSDFVPRIFITIFGESSPVTTEAGTSIKMMAAFPQAEREH